MTEMIEPAILRISLSGTEKERQIPGIAGFYISLLKADGKILRETRTDKPVGHDRVAVCDQIRRFPCCHNL
jgi:hypothetical protein